MIWRALISSFTLLLASCGGGPVQPNWQNNAEQSLNSFSTAYLNGNTALATREFAQARNELASTGRIGLVARAELVRCAVQVASLSFDDCPGFTALAQDADADELNYANFLQGKAVTPSRLPVQYRGLLENEKYPLSTIEPPLSRLIAAGVLVRRGHLTAANIALAVDTASAQGWRRALLAWLEVQARQAENSGQHEAALLARRRSALIQGKP